MDPPFGCLCARSQHSPGDVAAAAAVGRYCIWRYWQLFVTLIPGLTVMTYHVNTNIWCEIRDVDIRHKTTVQRSSLAQDIPYAIRIMNGWIIIRLKNNNPADIYWFIFINQLWRILWIYYTATLIDWNTNALLPLSFLFQDPKDTPPPTRVETRDERKERKVSS